MAKKTTVRNSVSLTSPAMILVLAIVATLTANAQTFSVIHAFTGGPDGSLPTAGVSIRNGNLYGTTFAGGGHFWGVVYQAKRSGNNWLVTPLSYLPISGSGPGNRALFGPDGKLYGTTWDGGDSVHGNVYSLTVPSSICRAVFCPWLETELHKFSGPDGNEPANGDLIWDQQGNIYGTTLDGGQHNANGTVFEMMPSGNGWITVPIYSFSGPDGSHPYAGLVIDSNGNLFGTTSRGGPNDLGVVFELKNVVGVGWQETVLYNFQNGDDGALPFGGLIFDNAGNLYGTAIYGGSAHGGTVFELSPSGNNWTFHLLYSLTGPSDDGCGSQASLSFDAAGSLYGTTVCGGSHGGGTVFKLAKTGNGWAYTELHSFDPVPDGEDPICSVAIDSDGTLYGTTEAGGQNSKGTLWMIKP